MGAIGEWPAAIFLDLDDTLIYADAAAAVWTTCILLGDRLGFDPESLRRANGAAFRPFFAAVESDWALGRVSDGAVRREVWRRTLAAVGADDETVVDLAETTFATEWRTSLHVYEDARSLLAAIPESVPVAVITNGPSDAQREKIQAVSLMDQVDVVVASGDLGVAKPHPRIFAEAADALAVEATSCWHIGDGLDTDVAGANASGLTSVWVNRRGKPRSSGDQLPTYEVATLAEVEMIMR